MESRIIAQSTAAEGATSMQDDTTATPQSVRNYEKRLHRHRQLYWRTLLPVVVVLAASAMLGFPMQGILLASLGVLIALLFMLREVIDVLGYLGSLQRDAAISRAALHKELAEQKVPGLKRNDGTSP
ncbi:MAG: hypothetical protein LC667_08705 [Thioalkalivibrio sp.]|nr:hypothetical protein [Thioalkalivibrio sp.]